MASQAIYARRAATAMERVKAQLSLLFDTSNLTLPTASRHGAVHVSMLQWETLADWLEGVTMSEAPPPELADVYASYSDALPSTVVDVSIKADAWDDAFLDTNTDSDSDDEDAEGQNAQNSATNWLPYSRKALLDLAAQYHVTVEGTGREGYITKEDLIKALEHAGVKP